MRAAITAAILAACAGSAGAQSGPVEGCGKAHAMRAMFDAGLNPDGTHFPGPREASTDTDVLSNNLDIEIVPSTSTISGSNTMTVKCLKSGLTTFTFMLRSNYTISQALYNGTTALTVTGPGANSYARQVALPAPLNAGDVFTLKITYSGAAVSRGFGSIDFTTQNGQTLVESLSEPYYAATWWPCKDGDVFTPGDNSDKATFQIAVTAPSTLVTISNGLLQGVDTLSGGRKRYRWATNYPTASYLACFASTNYNTWSTTYSYPLSGGGTGTMPVQFYIYPASDTTTNRNAWQQCTQMMATYRPMYGEYPFVNEKYGIYQFNFGGGMEHQTMTGEGTFDEHVTAHELGHQWWGDNVTCRTWSDIWLNEGFADYTEALWDEHKPGSTGLAALKSAMASRRPPAGTGSVYKFDTSNPNTIFDTNSTYYKGGWVLHVLRHSLGSDQTFWDVLAGHRAQHQGGGATTDDFAAVVATVTGKDWTSFFNAWVYGTGEPTYAYSYSSATVNGKNYLKLHLRQTQSASYPAVFPALMDVRVATAGGTATYGVFNDARDEYFVLPLTTSGAVSSVTLDPDIWIYNNGKVSESFVAGPPTLLETAPTIGQQFAPGTTTSQVVVTFSEPVNGSAANFMVDRDGSPVAFTYAYASGPQQATLDFGNGLPPGLYTVHVLQSLKSVAGVALDGEITGTTLPSGNGQAGGDAVFQFRVQKCPADFNGDGFVDFYDFTDYVTAFESGAPGGDFNGDGFVDIYDFSDFVTAFESSCP